MKHDPERTVYVEKPTLVCPGVWRSRWRHHDRCGYFVVWRGVAGWIAGPEGDGALGHGASKRAAIAAWEAKVLAHPRFDAVVWCEAPAAEIAA